MENRRGIYSPKLPNTKSNNEARPLSGYNSKLLLSPINSSSKGFGNNRNKSKDKYFTQKNSQKVLLTKSSASVMLTKNSVAHADDKSVHVTEKFMTEHDLSKINEEGKENLLKESHNTKTFENFKSVSEEIKTKVEKIFSNFAKFSKEEGNFILSQQALIKILRYVNIVNDKDVKTSDIDLILKKVCAKNSTKINQEQFLDFTAQLAYKLDPMNFSIDAKQTILSIVKNFYDPFVEFIENQNQQSEEKDGSESQLIQLSIPNFVDRFEIDHGVASLISSVYPGIREIYQIYFKSEIKETTNLDQLPKESFAAYNEFCRDYELVPFLLNMNQTATYWNHVNNSPGSYKQIQLLPNQKDLGKIFTLNKFALMIVHFSIMTYTKVNQTNALIPDFDKLKYFLDKLENSKGNKNLERKTNKPHKGYVTLVPQKEFVKQITSNSNLNFSVLSDLAEKNKTDIGIDRKVLKENNINSKVRQEGNLRSILSVSNEVIQIIEEKLEVFKEIFSTYAKIGDKLNFNKLNYTGFLKFLKDCDVIYLSSLSSNKSSSQLNPNNSARRPFSPNRNVMSSPSANSLKNSQRAANSNIINGRLIESEAYCVFCNLTGYQNFDNTTKFKNYFNLNKGFAPKIGESTNSAKLTRSKLLTTTKTNVPLKMDFTLFIKSFELIGKRLYNGKSLDEAVLSFIENVKTVLNQNFKKLIAQKEEELNNGKRLIIELLQTIRKESIIELIKDIHHVVMLHYENYCNNLGYMDFDQFYNFYKDFGLFPELVNLVQVRNIFFALSDILYSHYREKSENKDPEMKNTPEAKYIKEYESKVRNLLAQNEYINFDLFLDSLAVSSTFVKYSDSFNELDKILYLVEKMNQSKGISASQKRNGSTFTSVKDFSNCFNYLREKYPEFFRKKQQIQNGNKIGQIKFNKIFDS